ncbi:MAG TPA: Gfo/Idh/MocA family oxidoreductase, partial [Planctomycetes bacterium]|nr:Gfo/Idh/MocA family oxidoreductase [Planctomycetota bacterium]
MKELRIGMIGYGFMGKAHSNAYQKVNRFFDLKTKPVLQALCARDKENATSFASNWGYASVESDWRALIERDDIDAIDICVPNHLHHDIAVAAAEAGKWVLCEKPLAMNVAEAVEMTEAVEAAGVPNMVWFNYRRVPAIALARQLVDEGRIGKPFHYRGTYLQDWTIAEDVPQGGATLWRLDLDAA